MVKDPEVYINRIFDVFKAYLIQAEAEYEALKGLLEEDILERLKAKEAEVLEKFNPFELFSF